MQVIVSSDLYLRVMGTAGSVNVKPQSPYHRLRAEKIRTAKRSRYIDGDASDFYSYCATGDVNRVRQSLDTPGRQSIDELVKLERNGDTALHAATREGHKEIVKLLLNCECSRTILNRTGRVASEEATTPEMQRLFVRSEASDRFHDSDLSKTVRHYLPKNVTTDTTGNEPNTVKPALSETNNLTTTAVDKTSEFFDRFHSEEETYEYSLNHQTTAMWLRFFNWFSRTFPSLFDREDLNLESFQLNRNEDFNLFLKEQLGSSYSKAVELFDNAHENNSIDTVLKIYTMERITFYRSLNRQLTSSAAEAESSPHLCDRYIIEFHLRADELAKRSFLGTVYRGATINSSEVSLYEEVRNSKPRGVITFKAFCSTSEDKNIALGFIIDNPIKTHQTAVLFIIDVKVKSPTIVGIGDISEFHEEEEILMMPGNLFIVKNIIKDVIYTDKRQKSIKLTEIHLEYLHIPVSFWKKLAHTYRAANKNVVS